MLFLVNLLFFFYHVHYTTNNMYTIYVTIYTLTQILYLTCCGFIGIHEFIAKAMVFHLTRGGLGPKFVEVQWFWAMSWKWWPGHILTSWGWSWVQVPIVAHVRHRSKNVQRSKAYPKGDKAQLLTPFDSSGWAYHFDVVERQNRKNVRVTAWPILGK